VHGAADRVAAQVFDHAEFVFARDALDRRTDVAGMRTRACNRDSRIKRLAGRGKQLARIGVALAYRERAGRVDKVTVVRQPQVE